MELLTPMTFRQIIWLVAPMCRKSIGGESVTMQVAVVSIFLSSTIALVAYFYKEWKSKIETYIQQLSRNLWIIRNNEQILRLMLQRTVQAKRARAKLEFLPAFELACIPSFDSLFRSIIYRLNARIVFVKESLYITEEYIEVALMEIETCKAIFEEHLKFIINVLYDNAFWYYVFKWGLKRALRKKEQELDEAQQNTPKDKQTNRDNGI